MYAVCTVKLLMGKRSSITDDGESLNPAFSVPGRRVMVTTAQEDVVIG
jgi:hypothetical protein